MMNVRYDCNLIRNFINSNCSIGKKIEYFCWEFIGLYIIISACIYAVPYPNPNEASDETGLKFEWKPTKLANIQNHIISKEGIKIFITSPVDQIKIVNIHNHFRCQVRPPATDMLKLRWLEDAAKLAMNRVQQCYKGHDKEVERTPKEFSTTGCGQNIAYTPSLGGWEDIIVMWFREGKGFVYGGPQNGLPIKHYTQLVWSSTKYVGCAMAICPNDPFNRTYHWVCNYCPKGNIKNEMDFPYIAGHKQSCKLCPGKRKCTQDQDFSGKLFDMCDLVCQNLWGSCNELHKEFGCSANTSDSKTVSEGCPRQCNPRCSKVYTQLKALIKNNKFKKYTFDYSNNSVGLNTIL